MSFRARLAQSSDVPALQILIAASVRGLQAGDYTPAQLEGALASVYGVDTRLISDGTYFVIESGQAGEAVQIVGCGGWSRRKTLYGGDQYAGRQDDLLDPATEVAKIRAFFVHPSWARRGIGSLVLDACEQAAIAAGFKRLEMGATLTGVPFYRARGYIELEHLSVPLSNGESLAIVRMARDV